MQTLDLYFARAKDSMKGWTARSPNTTFFVEHIVRRSIRGRSRLGDISTGYVDSQANQKRF